MEACGGRHRTSLRGDSTGGGYGERLLGTDWVPGLCQATPLWLATGLTVSVPVSKPCGGFTGTLMN